LLGATVLLVDDAEQVRATAEAGARDFIVKSFGSARSLAGVHKLLTDARAG
jgi:DNA-binding NarL/FixJ family response regulator